MKLGSFFHGPQLWRFIKRNVISKQKISSCSPMVPHLYRGSWPLCSCFGGPKQLCLCLGLAFHIWIFHYFLALLLYKNKQTNKQLLALLHGPGSEPCLLYALLLSLDSCCFHASGGWGMSALFQYCIVLLQDSMICS